MKFDWRCAPMDRGSLNPWKRAQFVFWLARLLRKERVDLLHAFTIQAAILGSLSARIAGTRCRVNSIAGMGYIFSSQDLRARVLRPFVRLLMRLTIGGKRGRLIVQNPDDRRVFENSGMLDVNNIRMIRGSGVDCGRFTPRDKVRSPGPLRVLLASRLLVDKGVLDYIDAARLLRENGRIIDFILAGDGDPGNPASIASATIVDWDRAKIIRYLGHVDDMLPLFGLIDLIVLPSYREGLPRSLIEAAACGLAIITTDVPGCREVVTDGVDGLLVPVRDPGALAAAIARIDDDRILAATLGQAARRKALSEFDQRIVNDQTIAVYKELIGANPPR